MKHPLPAQITQIKTMAKGVRLTIDTQETLTSEQKAEIFDLYEKVGWFFFLNAPEAKIKTDDLPPIHLEEGEKSPGQRLRAVLFRWWEQNGKRDEFELFYRRHMERIIEQVKERLA